MEQVWRTVEQFHMLEPGDRVLVAVSGGPDSIALLHLLDKQKEKYGIELFVVHVNHQLRTEAEQEATYVQQVCRERNLPFQMFSIDVQAYARQNSMSMEQAGHEVRHNCFRECKERWQITKLALGHHGDDRAESVLLHLVQGCGLDGLTAMPPQDGWIIRPLAEIRKQDLIAYCEAEKLHYFIDSSNLETEFLRNRIRLEILPELRQLNPQITDALLRLQDSCAADADYLERCTAALWEQYGSRTAGQILFPADVLKKQHTALQRRILRYLYRQLTGSETNLTFRQVEQMQHIALQQNGSQQIHLTNGVIFFREYNTLNIAWRQKKQTEAYRYIWNLEGMLSVPEWNGMFQAVVSEKGLSEEPKHQNTECAADSSMEIAIDADQLRAPLQIRSRQPGDRLVMPYGHKKLKQFFIDKKVPASERGRIPLVLSGEEIIWIPGYYLADCVRITGETKRICRLSCYRK